MPLLLYKIFKFSLLVLKKKYVHVHFICIHAIFTWNDVPYIVHPACLKVPTEILSKSRRLWNTKKIDEDRAVKCNAAPWRQFRNFEATTWLQRFSFFMHWQYRKRQTTVTSSTLNPYYDVSNLGARHMKTQLKKKKKSNTSDVIPLFLGPRFICKIHFIR